MTHSLASAGNPHSPAPSSRFKFNLNDWVYFTPNEQTEPYLRDVSTALFNKPHMVEKHGYHLNLRRGHDGRCKWQIWEFMQIFGPAMALGNSFPIEPEVEFEHAE